MERGEREEQNMNTKPQVVLITGASAGVGRATACAFARRGAHIGLLARGPEGLDGARKLGKTGY
jgi:NADP-dependent 3-hydroxy acid dehydrogenase YdfG